MKSNHELRFPIEKEMKEEIKRVCKKDLNSTLQVGALALVDYGLQNLRKNLMNEKKLLNLIEVPSLSIKKIHFDRIQAKKEVEK